MCKENEQALCIISKGDFVMLRNRLENDNEYFARWQSQGEWQLFDAPWEESSDEEKRDRNQAKQEPSGKSDTKSGNRAVIATLDNTPLGWVSRYGEKNNSSVWYVGIDICEDAYLNRGYGTEALCLWIDHLFKDREIHKICLDTWSFNPRMVRVAEKIGFRHEGSQREMQYWQGKWLDLLHFGMLRDEWERIRQSQL